MVKKVRITVSLDKEDYDYLANLAKTKGLSFSDVLRIGVKDWIRSRQKQAANTQ